METIKDYLTLIVGMIAVAWMLFGVGFLMWFVFMALGFDKLF